MSLPLVSRNLGDSSSKIPPRIENAKKIPPKKTVNLALQPFRNTWMIESMICPATKTTLRIEFALQR